MIIIESKRKKPATLERKYPAAAIVDVTSHAGNEMVQFSPFYPHGGIPVPFSDGVTSMSVEGIWQGLKVFRSSDVDMSCFRNGTMKNLKRTVRVNGPCLGHRKGVRGSELLGYLEARKRIYLPSYRWVLDHRLGPLVDRLRRIAESGTLVLLDYETNPDVLDPSAPLSHAALIKAYIEGTYPVFDGAPVDDAAKVISADAAPKEVSIDSAVFSPGRKVRHAKFGEGSVVSVDPASCRIVVDFISFGRKTLAVRLANLQVIE